MGKSKKEKKKHKKKSKRRSDSSSSSSEEEIWVEKEALSKDCDEPSPKPQIPEAVPLEDWVPTYTRSDLKEKKNTKQKEQKDNFLDKPGHTSRELNPYWKDGGTGLPEEQQTDKLELVSSTTGDHGVHWLRKALQRAKEQAIDEGKSLEDVVSDRWGSLEKLQSLLKDAEKRQNPRSYQSSSSRGHNSSQRSYDDRKHHPHKDQSRSGGSSKDDRHIHKSYDDYRSDRKQKRVFMKPSTDDVDYPSRSSGMRHKDEGSSTETVSRLASSSCQKQSGSGWRKKEIAKKSVQTSSHQTEKDGLPSCSAEPKSKPINDEDLTERFETLLTEEEMNKLGAKIVKAEIMGDTELVARLKEKIEKARSCRSLLKSNKIEKAREEEIILTKTTDSGFTVPVKGKSLDDHSRRKRKFETHKDGQRVRYFADDDKHDIKTMFEREKMISARDQNEEFMELASYKKPSTDDRDFDDIFEETAAFAEGEGKKSRKEWNKAVNEQRKKEKMLDNCLWCFESRNLPQAALVSVADKIYLCVPPFQSLTEGHCLIIPTFHTSCSLQLDEDVWEQVTKLRKSLVSMFAEQEMDVVFFENAAYLHKHPHMVMHCVPVPKEIGDVAPIYFKKALLECEHEWSDNKKVVDLAGKGLMRCIPKGLPYFFVDFAMTPGYAHVIEDQRMFPNNFAQEVIGGMMDLDHALWRKPKREMDDTLLKKAKNLRQMYEPFKNK